MDLMLDTCALLSLAGLAKRKLSKATLEEIAGGDSLYLSACSLFEISLKLKRGQLSLEPYSDALAFWESAIEAYDCEVVAVSAEDFEAAVRLPDHHADPFDRIIIAQAMRLKCAVVTYDRLLGAYPVAVVE